MATDHSPGGYHYTMDQNTQPQAGLEVVPQGTEKYWVPTSTGAADTTIGTPSPRPEPAIVYAPASQGNGEKTLFGLRRPTAILAILLALVTVAAGVIGGVVGTAAVNNARTSCLTSSCPSSSTNATTSGNNPPSSTPTSGFVAPTAALLALDCPAINGSTTSFTLGSNPSKTWTFRSRCGTDINNVVDHLALIAYSLRDCAEACASMNLNAGENKCAAFAFNADMAASVPQNFGTCFLKASVKAFTITNRNNQCTGVLT